MCPISILVYSISLHSISIYNWVDTLFWGENQSPTALVKHKKQVPSRLPRVNAQVLEINVKLTESNTNQSGSMFAHPMEVLSQPSPWHQEAMQASPSRHDSLPIASQEGWAPGLVATGDVMVFHSLQRKRGTLLVGFFCLLIFHLLKVAHHVSTFVVLQLFIFLSQYICSPFQDLTTLLQSLRLLMRSSVAHVRQCAMFFLHNRNSSIWGFFLGCSKIWMMGNPVDTPKFGRYEPWFPLKNSLQSTHHNWGHGGDVLDPRDAFLALQKHHRLPGYPPH